MSFQLLNRTVFPFKNVLALKHIFCHNATMIYKFDSFWSYIGDEPDYVLTQVKDILTCHDYNYTTEQYTDVKFWLTHTNILGQEVLKFPTGLCEYVAQKTGCQIEHKKTQYDTYTGSDVLQIAQKVQKLFPGFEVRDYQKDLTLASVDKYSSMIVASVGSGKMEDKNNIIPTPDGFRRFGDLKPGDRVFGINGKPQKVLQTFEQGIQDIYRVSFRNGGYVDCGLEHLWTVRVISEKKNVTKTTKELIDSKIQKIDKRGFIARKFAVDYPLPVEYKEKEFFIDPYVLGVMIGDGYLCGTSLAISIPDMDSEIIEMVQKRLKPGYVIKKDTAPVCPRYIIKKPNEDYRNKYMLEVKRLGLNVVGGKKFIPQEYFLGSVQQRKDLLSGLMDTDGTCQKRSKKSSTSFSTTSKQLAEDIASLVRSLSGWCNIRKTDRTSSGRSIEYTVIMQLDFNPFKSQRKAERFTPFRQYNYITSIEKVGQADCMCILVENKDHLYITKDYIPTHNTSVMSMLVMLWKNKRILITNNQNFILKQIYDRLLAMGISKDEIATGTTDLTKRIVIISTQTSYNRIKSQDPEYLEYLKSVEVVINDECFSKGTKISTPDGEKFIEDIRVGDIVYCFDEKKHQIVTEKVLHTFVNNKNADVIIKINGTTIKCTKNHPFYTNYGWKTAEEIYNDKTNTNYLFLVQKRSMDNANQLAKTSNSQRWTHILFKRMQNSLYVKNIFRNHDQNQYTIQREIQARQTSKQPDAQKRNQDEDVCNIEVYWTQTKNTWWQWQGLNGAAKNIIGIITRWVVSGVCSAHRRWQKTWRISDMLQNRYSASSNKNCNRSGWRQSQFATKKKPRQKKGIIFDWVGLDSIEISKQRNNDEFVYNFEVNRCNNYFAEGVLVHNCQHFQSVSNFSMLFYMPNLQHLVGYTGSPFRNPNKPYSNATDMTTIALFGEPAITYSMEDSIENQNIATPYSYFINYDCYKMEYMTGTDFFVQYNRSIVYNKQRNKAGIEILRFLHNNGIKTLGLFRIVKKHGLVILKELKKYGVKALFLQGGETIYECDSKLKITSRKGGIDEIKKALHEDGYNIILASQVMDEGVDISSFQCGVLFTGGKSAIKIVQQTGRVSRAKSSGENISLVIDFNDTPINRMFANQYKERKKTLKQNGVIELQNLQEVIDIVNRMKA